MTNVLLLAVLLTSTKLNPTLSTTISPSGWQSAWIGGTLVINEGNTTLPEGVSITTDSVSNMLSFVRSISLNKSQGAWNTVSTAQASLKYTITTSEDFLITAPITVTGNTAVTVGANTTTHAHTAISSATSSYKPKSVVASCTDDKGEDAQSVGPESTKFQKHYPGGLSWGGSPEAKTTVALVKTGFIHSALSASYGGPYGGNMTVAVANTSSHVKVALTLMEVDSSKILTATKQSFEKIFWVWVDSEKWTVDCESGSTLYFDYSQYASGSHDVFFKATASLRKKITTTFTSGAVSLGSLNLTYGDLDGNNAISNAEVNWVSTCNGSSVVDGDWFKLVDVGGGVKLSKHMADINGDYQVDAADVDLVAGNAGLVGD